MAYNGYLVRNPGVVWRDIASEVVIADRDNSKIRILNKVASLIWILADGSKQIEDIADAVYERFEVSREQASSDSEEFLHELLEAKLVSIQPVPQGINEV